MFSGVVFGAITAPAALLAASGRNLAGRLHLAILIVAGALLLWGLISISTEDLRQR